MKYGKVIFSPRDLYKYTSLSKSPESIKNIIRAYTGIKKKEIQKEDNIIRLKSTGVVEMRPATTEVNKTNSESTEVNNKRKLESAILGAKIEKQIAITFTPKLVNKMVYKEFDDFIIKGYCDGITIIDDKQYVVEIKTRITSKPVMTIAEKIQCLAYNNCLNIPNLKFIQCINEDQIIDAEYINFSIGYRILWERVLFDLKCISIIIREILSKPHKYIVDEDLNMEEISKIIYWI